MGVVQNFQSNFDEMKGFDLLDYIYAHTQITIHMILMQLITINLILIPKIEFKSVFIEQVALVNRVSDAVYYTVICWFHSKIKHTISR